MTNRIDLDDKGNLDDVFIENVSWICMEWMDDKSVWMRFHTGPGDDDDLVFWLRVEKDKIVGRQGNP
jgi:hypothetical protein